MGRFAGLYPMGDGLLPAPRLCPAHRLMEFEIPPPGFEPNIGRGQELRRFDGRVARPQPAGRAEIRDAAFGGNTGTREGDEAFRLLDEFCEFLYFVCRASHYDRAA